MFNTNVPKTPERRASLDRESVAGRLYVLPAYVHEALSTIARQQPDVLQVEVAPSHEFSVPKATVFGVAGAAIEHVGMADASDAGQTLLEEPETDNLSYVRSLVADSYSQTAQDRSVGYERTA